ncbi:MAG TPA: hypothetical protein VH370_16570 [Humisphaera sp.]|nr:hypothetical protein [Humisphaera sp.]
MLYEFRWNNWNEEHIAEHGIDPRSAEWVVNHPFRGFPREHGDDKFIAWGQIESGHYLQVIYTFDPPGVVYVIHARPLTDKENRRVRRGRR